MGPAGRSSALSGGGWPGWPTPLVISARRTRTGRCLPGRGDLLRSVRPSIGLVAVQAVPAFRCRRLPETRADVGHSSDPDTRPRSAEHGGVNVMVNALDVSAEQGGALCVAESVGVVDVVDSLDADLQGSLHLHHSALPVSLRPDERVPGATCVDHDELGDVGVELINAALDLGGDPPQLLAGVEEAVAGLSP